MLFCQDQNLARKEKGMRRYFIQDTLFPDLERFMVTLPKPPHPNDQESSPAEPSTLFPIESQENPGRRKRGD